MTYSQTKTTPPSARADLQEASNKTAKSGLPVKTKNVHDLSRTSSLNLNLRKKNKQNNTEDIPEEDNTN